MYFIKGILIILLSFISLKTEDYKYHNKGYNIKEIPLQRHKNKQILGTATWYGERFHGGKTSTGEIYNMYGISCATRDRTIPFGSKLKITNIETGKSIIVTVNNRMAKTGKHTIDLSVGAFVKLAPKKQGVIKVKIEKL